MYSSLKNIQILVSLLKAYQVKHIVISAGTRHTPFVYSVEHDDFFVTYSIVDERSASFFAIGLIEKLREPVAVCCTSGTAAANYVSAANEAFYQHLPLLILTADRNHYYMFQQEEQMIPQEGLYSAVCKKVVTLCHVRDDKDFWYVSRICNEALLELTQGEAGPVHINFVVENDYPIKNGIVKFDAETLPDVKKIKRLLLEDDDSIWKEWADKLQRSKVLIVYGQFGVLNEAEKRDIVNFSESYNCIFSADLLSNLHIDYMVNTYSACRILGKLEMDALCPDIIITMNGFTISGIKGRVGVYRGKFSHWHVTESGQVSDPLKCLADVIACSPQTFFHKFAEFADNKKIKHTYYEAWMKQCSKIGDNGSLNNVEIPFSSLYAVQQYIRAIPGKSLLHIANSNSIRLANYFSVNPTVEVYGNRGSHGIDGSMSAFIGQSVVQKGLSFLMIGDLSFFYDMNALWNQYLTANLRIMVCNNSGGAIFHSFPNTTNVPTLDDHIAAEHKTSVKAWSVSRGFEYMSAGNKKEVNNAIEKMIQPSNKPIILEVFTDKDVDADVIEKLLVPYRSLSASTFKKVGDILPDNIKQKLKKIIR